MARRRRYRNHHPNRVFLPYAFFPFQCLHFFGILFTLSLLVAPIYNSMSCSSRCDNYTVSDDVVPNVTKTCTFNLSSETWPPNPPGPTLVLGFLMTRTGQNVREKLGLKIPGMMSLAVERINTNDNLRLPDNYTLQMKVRDSKGDEVVSTKHVTDLFCEGIDGFIGPESSCWVEANIAEAQELPMISYACPDDRASERKTFARTNPSEIHILKATIATLEHFQWKKFSLLYEDNQAYQSMVQTFKSLANEKNFTLNHDLPFSIREDTFPSIFLKTKNDTRVYVLISHSQSVPKALLAMTLSGLLNKSKTKEYILIYVANEEFVLENWLTFVFDPITVDMMKRSSECLLKDLQNYENGFMVVSNNLPDDLGCLAQCARDYNRKEPFCYNSDVNKALIKSIDINEGERKMPEVTQQKNKTSSRPRQPPTTQHVPFLPASHLYDAVMLYAWAVREIYKERFKGGKSTSVKMIGRNGTAIAEKLTNITFESILGFNVTMGSDRASEGSYSVYFFENSELCKQDKYSRLSNTCKSHCLVKIGDYVNKGLETTYEIDILAEPECGYDNSNCVYPYKQYILYVLATSIVLVFFISILQYRHWKYEQEISGLLWRIDKEKLIRKNPMSQSRVSIASVVSQDMNFQIFLPFERIADYRGTTCCLKGIDLENKKQDLNRKVMKKMRAMREIKHRNVSPFIGAYVDEKRLTLVTEYANRGSLEDILENEDIKLDELFISSLVQDLLRAMSFLHQSFGAHGNLKSTNCVVTSRWVLQVTDYDLHEIRLEAIRALGKEIEDESSPEGKKYIKSQLWRAPELLRQDPIIPGTREGDVYSFGIILHEVIARQGPFSSSNGDTVSIQAIVDEIKLGNTVSGSLRRPNTIDCVSMPFGTDPQVKSAMENAWAEDPRSRPDFKELSSRLKKMKKNRGNLVDHMVTILEEHNKNLEELVSSRTYELREEKKKSEELLYSMLPSSVAKSLCKNVPVEPQSYDSVTIYFSDIVGFTALASESKPIQIFNFLDDLYREFDDTIRGYDVYKVETIGDAYMVVSGLPQRNQGRHAGEIASMALELLEKTKSFKIKHQPDTILKLRIGLHTGPVIAGVVGHTMPRYCLFGDTVNTASRMESNGEPLRIHISDACKAALDALGGYQMEKRDPISVKGKGIVQTYWLNSADERAIQRTERPTSEMDFFEAGGELRRRSPRLSIDYRPNRIPGWRTPSVARSICDADEGGRTARSDSFREKDLATYHWRRLSNAARASSLECTTRGGLLSPPQEPPTTGKSRTSSVGSVRESHSLDRLPTNAKLMIPPTVKNLRESPTPSSSEPTFPIEDPPRGVNFSPSAKYRDEFGNEAELNPMLDTFYIGDNDREDSIRTDSPSSAKRGSILNFIHGIFPKAKRDRLNSEKSSLNGLQRESHV